jgi:hypothetical protein
MANCRIQSRIARLNLFPRLKYDVGNLGPRLVAVKKLAGRIGASFTAESGSRAFDLSCVAQAAGEPQRIKKGTSPLAVPSNTSAVDNLPLSNNRRRGFTLADVLGAASDAKQSQHRGRR